MHLDRIATDDNDPLITSRFYDNIHYLFAHVVRTQSLNYSLLTSVGVDPMDYAAERYSRRGAKATENIRDVSRWELFFILVVSTEHGPLNTIAILTVVFEKDNHDDKPSPPPRDRFVRTETSESRLNEKVIYFLNRYYGFNPRQQAITRQYGQTCRFFTLSTGMYN